MFPLSPRLNHIHIKYQKTNPTKNDQELCIERRRINFIIKIVRHIIRSNKTYDLNLPMLG